MLQAALSDGLLLDLLSHLQDFRAAAVIDIGGCQVGQALGEFRREVQHRLRI